MVGFTIVLLWFFVLAFYVSFAFVTPLIFGLISIPKGTPKKFLKSILYGLCLFFIQFLTICFTSILAKPYSKWFEDSILPDIAQSILFSIIPLVILISISIAMHKWVSKIKIIKKTIILTCVQSTILTFGIMLATITN